MKKAIQRQNEGRVSNGRLKVASIKDKWLKSADDQKQYELLVCNAFILIDNENKRQYIADTNMNDFVSGESSNLEYFFENTKSLQELKKIKRLRRWNIEQHQILEEDLTQYYFQKEDNSLLSRAIGKAIVTKNRIIVQKQFATSDGISIKSEPLELQDMRIYVEEKPSDPTRTSVINQNWLKWSQDIRIEGFNQRLVVQGRQNQIVRKYALYCPSMVDATRLRDRIIIQFNELKDSAQLMKFAVNRKKVILAEQLLDKMMNYCYEQLGAADLVLKKRYHLKDGNLSNNQQANLPLFMNKGMLALGGISLGGQGNQILRRSIYEWKEENLGSIELGYREQHGQDLPVFTFDTIICSVGEKDELYLSAFIDIGILRDRLEMIASETIGFTFKRRENGLVFMERSQRYISKSSIQFEEALKTLLEEEEISVRVTLRLSPTVFEDFEFNLKDFSRSFFMKQIAYVDFFKRKYIVVMKCLKLHKCPIYDEFTKAFEAQNIFIDDFYSKRIKLPSFNPSIVDYLEQSILGIERDRNSSIHLLSPRDGYQNLFYKSIFEVMRNKAIYDNFVKAKIGDTIWVNFATSLKPSKELTTIIKDYFNMETSIPIAKISNLINPSDAANISYFITICAIGIKNSVRSTFWESVVEKTKKYDIKSKLDEAVSLICQQLYSTTNEINLYGVNCLFRQHQRVCTHLMSIIKDMTIGNDKSILLLSQEIYLAVLMQHEFRNKQDFERLIRTVLILGSLMHESPKNDGSYNDTMFYVKKINSEICCLKYIMAQLVPNILQKISDLGLCVELVFGEILLKTFNGFFQPELCLRVRDLYFVFYFHSNVAKFDYFLLFKSCLICSLLIPHSALLMNLESGHDFLTVIQIIGKTHYSHQKLIFDGFYLMDMLVQGNNPDNGVFSHLKSTGIRDITDKFTLINNIVQKKCLEAEFKKFGTSEILDTIQYVNLFEENREIHSQSIYTESFFKNKIPDVPLDIPLKLPNKKCCLIPAQILKPHTFQPSPEKQIMIQVHEVKFRQSMNMISCELYLLVDDAFIFSSKIDSLGAPARSQVNLYPQDTLQTIRVELRVQGYDEQIQNETIDIFLGNINLYELRAGIIENKLVPCHQNVQSGRCKKIVQVNFSILLNYNQAFQIEDFEETTHPEDMMLSLENYWGTRTFWSLPEIVEQRSLLFSSDYVKFRVKYEQIAAQYGRKSELLDWFDSYLKRGYSRIPLSKAIIRGIIDSTFSIQEKISLCCEFLKRFDNEMLENNKISISSFTYLLKVIFQDYWPGIQPNIVDNISQLKTNYIIPQIQKAWFIIDNGVLIDLGSYFQSLINNSHLVTGEKQIDLSDNKLKLLIQGYIKEIYPTVDFADGLIFYQILTNNGVETICFGLETTGKVRTNQSILKEKTECLIIRNSDQPILITETVERLCTEGLMTNLMNPLKIYEFTNKNQMRVNCYILENNYWFQGVVIHNSRDRLLLEDIYSEWDKSVFELPLLDHEFICFLEIRPSELRIVEDDFIVFL